MVKVNLFAAIVRAKTNDIAFISGDVDELVLPIEAAQRRVILTYRLARFDGDRDRYRVHKLKARDGMRDPGRTPKVDREIDTSEFRQMNDACFPSRRVIGLSAILAVAHIMQSDFVVTNLRPGAARHIRLPRSIFPRLYR